MPDFIIETATDADVPALNQLVNSAYRGESSRRGWTTEADLLDGQRIDESTLRTMLAQPQAQILLCRVDGQLLGCVYSEKKGPELYLGMLTVQPDAQTGGLGKQLLAVAEKRGKEAGCQAVVMTVISQRHELIAWYERRSYHSTGETQPFPDDPRFGLPRQPLTFVVLTKSLVL